MNNWLFALATATILATPGPTNTLLAAAGAARGLRRSWTMVPAELAGYVLSIATWGLILAPIAARWPILAPILKGACALFLISTAIHLWRSAEPAAQGQPQATVTARRVFVATLLNPKAAVFAFAVFPPFAALREVAAAFALFAAVMAPISLAWLGLGASLVGRAGWVAPAVVQRVAAAVLVLFSVSLGLTTLG